MPENLPPKIIVSSSARARVDRALDWVVSHPAATEILVVGASIDAARELLHAAVERVGASFGWHRASLRLLVTEVAATAPLDRFGAPIRRIGADAVAARVVHELRSDDQLGRYAQVAELPGFIHTLTGCLGEIRSAATPDEALDPVDPGLSRIATAFAERLEASELADWPRTLLAATAAIENGAPRDRGELRHRWVGLPTLLLDVPIETTLEARFLAALLGESADALITLPAGDERSAHALARAGLAEALAAATEAAAEAAAARATAAAAAATEAGAANAATEPAHAGVAPAANTESNPPATSLDRLQAHLFDPSGLEESRLDDSVTIFSAPGQGRECVEIARQILDQAARGRAFDRIAILLRSAGEYRPHLEEALDRAGIPAYFTRGARRPDPAGRAFFALLRCRLESYSATRFAEYLSIGQVPDPAADGSPPEAPDASERWVPPDEALPERYGAELGPTATGAESADESAAETADEANGGESADEATTRAEKIDPEGPVSGGALRTPRRWEKLLVEASVVGGLDRWRSRLAGLEQELRLRLEALGNEDDSGIERIQDRLRELDHLRAFALPLLEEMEGWSEEVDWGTWLDRLTGLAFRALRSPGRILELLERLAPLASVGPVALSEVARVLRPHLLEVSESPAGDRYGRVFVGPIDAARGRGFDVVFVPGLADHLFPRPIRQEPILSDEKRRRLNAKRRRLNETAGHEHAGHEIAPDATGREGLGLPTTADRVTQEQGLLRLAVGAASEGVVLSYPRLDLSRSRSRVPSFYTLEAVRAAEGRLPLIEVLADRADAVTQARVGWPAPDDPREAIDTAEYDLAVLHGLFRADSAETGSAHYLLSVNPYLRRQLRARLRRWHSGWTWADGLAGVSAAAAEAIEKHRLPNRSFSATALQTLGQCPYKFHLYAVQRLRRRDEARPIESLDPLQRGGLIHEIQFHLFRALKKRKLLPVRQATLERALEVLDETLEETAKQWRERLVPAIPRVWDDEIQRIRSDLRRWLRLSVEDDPWTPWRFELAFGLGPAAGERDPESTPDPVPLECGIQLRGKIDLVEKGPEDLLRITDHKTGRNWNQWRRWDAPAVVIDEGRILQPVFYALAAEGLYPEKTVEGGRLDFCTTDGGFSQLEVPLDDAARRAAELVAASARSALEGPFLVAQPRARACGYCDFRPICGPNEERRTQRKPPIPWLEALRSQA